eukprot:gene5813-7414_t
MLLWLHGNTSCGTFSSTFLARPLGAAVRQGQRHQ